MSKKYCITHCQRCKRLVEIRNKRINGRKTVLCRIEEHSAPRITMYHGNAPNKDIHAPEKICPYYLPKETTSYCQLALESVKITEIKDNS